MSSFAAIPAQDDRYAIDLPLTVRIALGKLPERARAAVVRRLAEIAYVASSLRLWVTSDVDDMKSTMHFEVAGYAVSYAMSDTRRRLQVLGVVPLGDHESGSP